jgi:hypothetical protein
MQFDVNLFLLTCNVNIRGNDEIAWVRRYERDYEKEERGWNEDEEETNLCKY